DVVYQPIAVVVDAGCAVGFSFVYPKPFMRQVFVVHGKAGVEQRNDHAFVTAADVPALDDLGGSQCPPFVSTGLGGQRGQLDLEIKGDITQQGRGRQIGLGGEIGRAHV